MHLSPTSKLGYLSFKDSIYQVFICSYSQWWDDEVMDSLPMPCEQGKARDI